MGEKSTMGAFDVEDDGRTRVARLSDGSRGVNVVVKVIEKTEIREVVTKADGVTHRVCEALVADESGSIFINLWDENVDSVQAGQVIAVSNGYVSSFRGSIRLNVSRYGGYKTLDEAPFSDVNLGSNASLAKGRSSR